MIRVRAVLSVCLVWQVIMACNGGGLDTRQKADWTFMVYMGADNNLSTVGLGDLNELEQAGSDKNVNIVLQAEFSPFYTDFYCSGDGNYTGDTLRFLVTDDGDPERPTLSAGQSIGNVDMGAPETLTAFLSWATEQYPAEHYALVIWDHGAGWKVSRLMKGAVQDETSASFMSLPDLSGAVRAAGIHLDLINFDACLMAMYEVAVEFIGTTDYMVFSEEVVPGDGDPYDTILGALKARPGISGRELTGIIVDAYHASYSYPETRGARVTKSAVEMAEVPELHSTVLAFAEAIITDFGAVSTDISLARGNAQRFETPSHLDLFDFSSLIARNLAGTQTGVAARDVSEAVTRAVIENRALGADVSHAFGLAIYLPSFSQLSVIGLTRELQRYSRLACNQAKTNAWADVVEKMVKE